MWAAIPIVASLVVHAPVLGHWFHNDDLLHLYQLRNFGVVDFVLSSHGGHLYVVRNAVFAAAHGALGMWAAGYLALLLANHLLNVFFVFDVVRRFFGSAPVACVAALLWGSAVVHRGVVGWYTAHGIALVATLLLWILRDLARARAGDLTVEPGRALGWAALLVTSALCYGVGVALAVGFPLVSRLLLPDDAWGPRSFRLLLGVAVAMPVLYGALFAIPALGADTRPWEIPLAVLSPAAWLFMLRATVALFGYGLANLTVGPFAALGFDDPVTTSLSQQWVGLGPLAVTTARSLAAAFSVLGLLFLVGVCVLASRVSRDERRLLLGLLTLGLLSYGMIGIGRAFSGSMLGVDPALLATVARYQYVGSIPVCLLVGWGLARARPRSRVGRRAAGVLLGTWTLLLTLASLQVAGRVAPTDPRTPVAFERFRATVARVAATEERGETLWLRNRRVRSVRLGPTPPEAFPGWAALWVLSEKRGEFDGHAVRFVEGDADLVQRLRSGRGGRVARLVVTKEECGACVAH